MEDWWSIGNEFVKVFEDLVGIGKGENVLEVGSGCGRIANALAPRLHAVDGTYDGLDVQTRAIQWARRHVTSRYPTAKFHAVDVYNGVYNPNGKIPGSEVTFPFRDASFSFVYATSLFSHLLEADARRYLRECLRVVRPGGKVLLTFFLADRPIATPSPYSFRATLGVARVNDANAPEAAVAYSEDWVRATISKEGGRVLGIHPGQWRDPQGISWQDIVLIEKAK